MSGDPYFAESDTNSIGTIKYPLRGLPNEDQILGFPQCGPDGSSPGAADADGRTQEMGGWKTTEPGRDG